MRLKTWMAVGLTCVVAFAMDAPKGTVPRATAERYPAHSEQSKLKIGAALLKTDEVKHSFASDLNVCCVVVEVAFYPDKDKDGLVEVSLNDFVLRVGDSDIATKPSSPAVLAATLQRKADPGGREVEVSPTVGVGYENGTIDPVTGQRRGGVITSAGVGVGVGDRQPKPGSTEMDRRTMEQELNEKGLPQGFTSAPVAGYVYFHRPPAGKDKKNSLQLEYMLNGNKVVLPLQ